MSFTWSFDPTPKPKPIRIPSKRNNWVCPEHERFASSMKRDFPRDDLGRPLREYGRELVIDKKPNVMRPERKTYHEPNIP